MINERGDCVADLPGNQACQLYLARGATEGKDLDDRLQAERLLAERLTNTQAQRNSAAP